MIVAEQKVKHGIVRVVEDFTFADGPYRKVLWMKLHVGRESFNPPRIRATFGERFETDDRPMERQVQEALGAGLAYYTEHEEVIAALV